MWQALCPAGLLFFLALARLGGNLAYGFGPKTADNRLTTAARFGHPAMLFGLGNVGHHLVGRLHARGLE
jgi:hypothetical protein